MSTPTVQEVSTDTPVTDLQDRGYAFIPGLFDPNQLASLGIVFASYAFPLIEEPDQTRVVAFDQGSNIPVDKINENVHSYIFNKNGFIQLFIDPVTTNRIFRSVLDGTSYEQADKENFFSGFVSQQLVEAYARQAQANGLIEVFDHPIDEWNSYSLFFSGYKSGANVLGESKAFPHSDGVEDSAGLTTQIAPDLTMWRLARHKHLLPNRPNVANAIQHVGEGLVIDSHALSGPRCNTLHNPLVDTEGRISALVLCRGVFRDRLYSWLDDYAQRNGYVSRPDGLYTPQDFGKALV